MSDADRVELRRRLSALRRRHLWVAWLGLFLELLYIAGFALACALLVDRLAALARGSAPWLAGSSTVALAVAGLGALSAAGALVAAWRGAPRGLRFACAVDLRIGAEDRVATAAEVSRGGEGGPLGPALLADAVGVLRGVPGERLFPRPRIGYRALVILPLAVIVWLLTVPADAPAARGRGADRPPIVAPPPGPPLADFEAEPRRGAAPCTVRFRARPIGRVDRCRWDFGDGSAPAEGAEASHTYREAGTYDVRLEVYGPGGADVEVKPAHVRVLPAGSVVADFTAAPRDGPAPLRVRLVARLEGDVTAIRWIFGDGATGTGDRAPEHVYASPGRYTVHLDASGPGGKDSVTKEGYVVVGEHPPPEARFTAEPRQGAAPLRVRFGDRSLGTIQSRRWDFGDGTPAAEEKDPEHVYERPGVYSVTLSVAGPGGSDRKAKKNYIVVSDGLGKGGGEGSGGRSKGGGGAGGETPGGGGGPDKGGGGGAPPATPPSGPSPRPGTEKSLKPLLGEPERTPVTKVPREVDPLLREDGATKLRTVDVYDGGGGAPGGVAKPEAYDILYKKYRRQAEESVHGETVPGPVRDLVRQYFEAIRPGE
jgi:PKD repeat protein